jgi:pimeloyl-ACP methyl ester carboxylesterase
MVATNVNSVRHTLNFGQYQLNYEVYGSGDRVLVWLHPILFDSKLSRGLARALAARGNRVVLLDLLGLHVRYVARGPLRLVSRVVSRLPSSVRPARLTGQIAGFLDRVWEAGQPQGTARSGEVV